MRALRRKLRGDSTSAAVVLALALVASPLAAQKTGLTLTGGTHGELSGPPVADGAVIGVCNTRIVAASFVGALCAFVLPARAQSAAEPSQPRSSPSGSFASVARLDPSTEAGIMLPPATGAGAPRSYQVVSIPLPDELAHSGRVEIVIVPRGDF